jgi:hypothetical protein
MSHQSSARSRRRSVSKRWCPVCGLRSIHAETCDCCDQEWIVCHACGVALTRVA